MLGLGITAYALNKIPLVVGAAATVVIMEVARGLGKALRARTEQRLAPGPRQDAEYVKDWNGYLRPELEAAGLTKSEIDDLFLEFIRTRLHKSEANNPMEDI
jgi:hypothetical protein